MASPSIAVVIPCYRVRSEVLRVIAAVPAFVRFIICVDDRCPDGSGAHIEAHAADPRVRVFYNEVNLGVGGAVIRGFQEALALGAEIVAKIDGDGQMDPQLLPRFVSPIINGKADYVKGNRFISIESVRQMPGLRLFGNSVLSLMAKLSSGYWHLFDPNNGYVCCHAEVLKRLPLNKIAQRYFFESDMLFRLGVARALVVDVPMTAVYGDEKSSLRIGKVIVPFLFSHIRNFAKRVLYRYFLLDFNIASVELLCGVALLLFGLTVGGIAWYDSIRDAVPASAGTVMLAALPFITGMQLLISAINFDVTDVIRDPLHRLIAAQEHEEMFAADAVNPAHPAPATPVKSTADHV
jgi:glycosyltransferase involved in cell wall biosynthesis